jgi:hypothetical protein
MKARSASAVPGGGMRSSGAMGSISGSLMGSANGFVIGFVFGFVRRLGTELFQAFELLDGPAVKSFCLCLIANEELPGFGLADGALEAHREAQIAILCVGNLDIAGELLGEQVGRVSIARNGLIHEIGVEAGFEVSAAN